MFKFIRKYLTSKFFKVLYLFGISLFLPLIFSYNSIINFQNSLILLGFSFCLIIFSVIGLYYTKHTWRSTYLSLGFLTAIPGALSLVSIIYGKSIILSLFNNSYLKLESAEPYISQFLDKLPALWILSVAYILISLFMLYLAAKHRN